MNANQFMDTINLICKMATTDLSEAACESGYMGKLYDITDSKKLEDTIKKISDNFKNEIFADSDTHEKIDWIEKAQS